MPDDFSDFELLMENAPLEDLEEDLEAYLELDEDQELSGTEMFGLGSGEADFDTAQGRSSSASLMQAIPDSADWRRHVPLNYQLDAKTIVGKLAQDLGELKAPSTSELGKMAKDIFSFATGGSVIAPVNILLAALKNIPGGYMAASAKVGRDEAARGFSHGVVMGAGKKSFNYMKNLFGYRIFPPENYTFTANGRTIAMANYRAGLLAGFLQGRALTNRQRVIFWRDLRQRLGEQAYLKPFSGASHKQWDSWYREIATLFRRYHLK